MKRALVLLFAASTFILAQDQPGGWRRVGDRPASSAPAAAPAPDPAAPPVGPAADPEPVDRSDAYGQPIPSGQAPAPAPAQQAPAPTAPPTASAPARPAYGLPPQVTVKPGTYLTIRLNQMLSSDRNQPGDTFVASLAQPLVVDGIVVANRNQLVYGRVAEAQKAKSSQPSRLGLELTSITLADGSQVPIHSQLVGRQGGTTPAGQQVGTVAATTGIGAAIGAAADWGTGAAVGAGVGAIAGLAGVMLTRNHPTVVYPETPLNFAVQSPLTVSTANAPHAFRYVGPEDYAHPTTLEPRPRMAAAPYAYAPYPYPYWASPYPYYPYWGGVSVYVGPRWGYWGRGHFRRW